MTRGESALELATRYRDAFFARDADAIMALVTPDFVFENVTGALHARWPDMTFEEREGGPLEPG